VVRFIITWKDRFIIGSGAAGCLVYYDMRNQVYYDAGRQVYYKERGCGLSGLL
jgi:hypothetical protein